MTKKPITLTSPHLGAVLGDPADPDTWEELDVQTIGPDIIAAEALFVQRKWGAPTDRPALLPAVIAFHALRRTGQIAADTTWDQFQAGHIEISIIDNDEVGPTVPAPEAG